MGNFQYKHRILRDKNCLICYEKIKGNCISCLDCRTLVHHQCYFKWTNTNNFTKCPMCNQTETLLTSYLQQELDIDNGKIKF